MKLGWPFQLHISFSMGGVSVPTFEPESNRERALRWATERNPADTASPEVAVKAAEVYEAYLSKE